MLVELAPPGFVDLIDTVKLVLDVLNQIREVVQLHINFDEIPLNNVFKLNTKQEPFKD